MVEMCTVHCDSHNKYDRRPIYLRLCGTTSSRSPYVAVLDLFGIAALVNLYAKTNQRSVKNTIAVPITCGYVKEKNLLNIKVAHCKLESYNVFITILTPSNK